MAVSDTGLMRLLTEKMSYLGQRQTVLAQNVVNANTPKYKPRDLAPFTFSDAMREADASGLRVTDPRHIQPASSAGVNAGTNRMKSYETLPSGNAVDLEQQMMEVSQTGTDYEGLLAVYKKFIGFFKTALGK